MAILNTDFIVYDEVLETYSENSLTADQQLAINTPSNINFPSNDTLVGLNAAFKFNTSNLNIPPSADIVGYDVRIRARSEGGVPMAFYFNVNRYGLDEDNPFTGVTSPSPLNITTSTFADYIFGYSNDDTHLNTTQTVPLQTLIQNDTLALRILNGSAGDGQINFINNIGTTTPSIGLKIYYTSTPTKTTITAAAPTTTETSFQYFQEASPGTTVEGGSSTFTEFDAGRLLSAQFGGTSGLITWENNSANNVASYISLKGAFNDIDPIPDDAENIKLTLYYVGIRENVFNAPNQRFTFRFISPNEGSFNVHSEFLDNSAAQINQEITDSSLTPAFVNDPDLELQIHLNNTYTDSSGNTSGLNEENGIHLRLYGFETSLVAYDPRIKVAYDTPTPIKVKLQTNTKIKIQ